MKPRPLAVIRNRRLNSVALLAPLRSVQFRSQGTFRSVGLGMVDVRRGAPPGRSLQLEATEKHRSGRHARSDVALQQCKLFTAAYSSAWCAVGANKRLC